MCLEVEYDVKVRGFEEAFEEWQTLEGVFEQRHEHVEGAHMLEEEDCGVAGAF